MFETIHRWRAGGGRNQHVRRTAGATLGARRIPTKGRVAAPPAVSRHERSRRGLCDRRIDSCGLVETVEQDADGLRSSLASVACQVDGAPSVIEGQTSATTAQEARYATNAPSEPHPYVIKRVLYRKERTQRG
jgi:hypothetical protein